MKHQLLSTLFLLFGLGLSAQGLEGVLVERYHEQPGAAPGAAPLVTYRIYLDLEPGYALLSVYGEKDRNLFFRTSTRFFNDTLNGAGSGDLVDAEALAEYPAAIDSWLAFGFASSAHKAVPLHLDPDGSIMEADRSKGIAAYSSSLSMRDGLVPAPTVPEVMYLHITRSFLQDLSGQLIETEVGAYGVLGHVKGATDENMVLIAQLTTDGELSYAINAGLRAPDGSIIKWIAYPPKADDERQHPALHVKPGGEARF